LNQQTEVAAFLDAAKGEIEATFKTFRDDTYNGLTGQDIKYKPIEQGEQLWIDAHCMDLAVGINSFTEELIAKKISELNAAGAGVDEIAAGIREVFVGMEVNRSYTIAQTETAFAANMGALAAFIHAGIEEKEWYTADDERVCPVCGGVHGEVVGVREFFSIGILAPPAHPRCRCTIFAVIGHYLSKTPDFTARLQERLQTQVNDLDGVLEVGNMIRQEVADRMAAAEKEINKLSSKVVDLWREADDPGKTEAARQAAYKVAEETFNQLYDLQQRFKTLRANETMNILKEVRPMGGELAMTFTEDSAAGGIKHIQQAAQYFPADWVNTIAPHPLHVKRAARGYYNPNERPDAEVIALSARKGAAFEKYATIIATHELSHRMEYHHASILAMEMAFYEHRTAGEEATWLGTPYRENEVGRRDDFIDRYIGKDYGGRFYELLSIGMESWFFNTYEIEDDPEYISFILGVLATQ
jgi:SPP1 gp7 family putative phage head morphogenesis protein